MKIEPYEHNSRISLAIRKGNWFTNFCNVLIVLLVFGTFIALFWSALGLPEMRVDAITGECREIVPSVAGTCENPPKDYITTPVKPRHDDG